MADGQSASFGPALATVVGAVLLIVGVAVVTNWRGALERYSKFVDDVTPTGLPSRWRRPISEQVRWRRFVRRQRAVFVVIGCLGLGMVVAGAVHLFQLV